MKKKKGKKKKIRSFQLSICRSQEEYFGICEQEFIMQIRFVCYRNRTVCLGTHFCSGYRQSILQVKEGSKIKLKFVYFS